VALLPVVRSHLVRWSGFRQPLRDPWVHGMCIILKNANFSIISSVSDLPWNLDGSFRAGQRKTCNWDSPIFSEHASLLLMEFLGPGFLNWDGLSNCPNWTMPQSRKLLLRSWLSPTALVTLFHTLTTLVMTTLSTCAGGLLSSALPTVTPSPITLASCPGRFLPFSLLTSSS
jgi:hypothetical protein